MLRLILFCLCAFKMCFANWWKHANFVAKLFSLFRKHQMRFKHEDSLQSLDTPVHNMFFFVCFCLWDSVSSKLPTQRWKTKSAFLAAIEAEHPTYRKMERKKRKNNREWFTPSAHYKHRFVHKHSNSLTVTYHINVRRAKTKAKTLAYAN